MPERSTRADNSAEVDGPEATRLARTYLEALRAADTAGAYRVASRALSGGMSLAALYQRVITPAMHELGRLWEEGAITVADEHMATALTHRVLGALRPSAFTHPTREADSPKPRAMLAAVQGEQHVLGLRMAADLLEEAGYRAIYLGADVPTPDLLQAIEALPADLLALSATMPESALTLEEVVVGVRGLHPRLCLIVGGQAATALRVRGATPVDDLELLDERVRSP
ncbi:MAG: B12-binding domain-containing protein [Solirubrobacterales bacterium]